MRGPGGRANAKIICGRVHPSMCYSRRQGTPFDVVRNGKGAGSERKRAGIPGRAHLLTTHSAAQVLTGKRPASGQEAAKTDSRKGVISN